MPRRSRRTRVQSHTRSFLVITALMTMVVGVAAFFWLQPGSQRVAADPTAPGRLIADEATVDLGRVPFDRMVEARFTVANTGGDVVRLVGAPKVQMLEGC